MNYWCYIQQCIVCKKETGYISLNKDEYSYRDFLTIMNAKTENGGIVYDYCNKCKKYTRQILLSYDYDIIK